MRSSVRLIVTMVSLLAGLPSVRAQEETVPKAESWISPCEILCANLARAIQERPDQLVMRLEDALVINESCAPELVVVAMDAVRAEPRQVREILMTVARVSPSRAAVVKSAVAGYVPASLRLAAVMPEEEVVETAELPVEIRRAEIPHASGSQPMEEIRRAVPVTVSASPEVLPKEEIRRAGIIIRDPLRR